MREDEAWWLRAQCKTLTPENADALFFPGSGGKPHKAQEFCLNCPVRNLCIDEAIQGNYQGFFGGFTDGERKAIGKVNTTIKNEATLRGAIILPDDTPSLNRPLRIIEARERDRSWMDTVEPDDSSLNLIELLGNDEAAWDSVA